MSLTPPRGWTQAQNALTRTIARSDFVDALALIVEVGRLAEAANHHPDIHLHHYRQVDLTLSTHSAGHTVTEKDWELATEISDLSEDSIRLTKEELRRHFTA